jgi:hypothetical protein
VRYDFICGSIVLALLNLRQPATLEEAAIERGTCKQQPATRNLPPIFEKVILK